MTVRPSKPSIRKAPKPGTRQQAPSPRPEQPVNERGQVAEPAVTYEELLQYRRDADLKLREWKLAFERVYQILDEAAPSSDGQLGLALVEHQASQIARAKEELTQIDRSMPKMQRISMAPPPGEARPATRLRGRR